MTGKVPFREAAVHQWVARNPKKISSGRSEIASDGDQLDSSKIRGARFTVVGTFSASRPAPSKFAAAAIRPSDTLPPLWPQALSTGPSKNRVALGPWLTRGTASGVNPADCIDRKDVPKDRKEGKNVAIWVVGYLVDYTVEMPFLWQGLRRYFRFCGRTKGRRR